MYLSLGDSDLEVRVRSRSPQPARADVSSRLMRFAMLSASYGPRRYLNMCVEGGAGSGNCQMTTSTNASVATTTRRRIKATALMLEKIPTPHRCCQILQQQIISWLMSNVPMSGARARSAEASAPLAGWASCCPLCYSADELNRPGFLGGSNI